MLLFRIIRFIYRSLAHSYTHTHNTTMDSTLTIKQAEISIKKFNDVGIPHHLGLLKNHKSNIIKSLALGDWDKVKKEEINATRVIKQLKNLMLEMDILRGNVLESDLDKFDELTMRGRQKAKEAIQEYLCMYCIVLFCFVLFFLYRSLL